MERRTQWASERTTDSSPTETAPDAHTTRHLSFLEHPVDATVSAVRELLPWVTTLLVVARYPEGLSSIESQLTDRLSETQVKTTGLRQLARTIRAHDTAAPSLLSEREMNLELDVLIRNTFRTSPDRRLRDAVVWGQGERHIRRVIREALGQHRAITTTDDRLQRIERLRQTFVERLDEREAVVPQQLIGWATEALVDPTLRRRVLTGQDAIVVLDWEEWTDLDRRLLDRLATETPVVTLHRVHAALTRLWNEPVYRPIFSPRARPQKLPGAIATYLATGRRYPSISSGHAEIIDAPSRAGEQQAIVNRVREALTAGYDADEIIVASKDANAGLPAVTAALRAASVPTTKIVLDLKESGVAQEISTLATIIAGTAEPSTMRAHLPDEYALKIAAQNTCETVADQDSLAAGIHHWIEQTDLQERLTAEARHGGYHAHPTPRHIRTETAALTMVVEVASALDNSQMDDVPWATFAHQLDQEVARDTASLESVTQPHDRHGVAVVPAREAKYLRAPVVIVQGVTHDALTELPTIPQLWSRHRLTMPIGYPAHFCISSEEIPATFANGDVTANDSHAEFFRCVNWREIAVAAAAATDELVFTTHRNANYGGYPKPLETIQTTWDVCCRTSPLATDRVAIAESGVYD